MLDTVPYVLEAYTAVSLLVIVTVVDYTKCVTPIKLCNINDK